MFDTLTIRRPRSIEFVKTALKTLVGAYLLIGLTAGYRAYYQIGNLQLHTDEKEIRAGSKIKTNVVSYARVPITVKLELVQGERVAELSAQVVRKNDWAFLDPRPRSATQSLVINADMLASFQPGPARLRATAVGRQQLSHTPPPVVRELIVEIER